MSSDISNSSVTTDTIAFLEFFLVDLLLFHELLRVQRWIGAEELSISHFVILFSVLFVKIAVTPSITTPVVSMMIIIVATISVASIIVLDKFILRNLLLLRWSLRNLLWVSLEELDVAKLSLSLFSCLEIFITDYLNFELTINELFGEAKDYELNGQFEVEVVGDEDFETAKETQAELSDVEFFKTNPEKISETPSEEKEVPENEFVENYYRCYRYCRNYYYHHRYYRRCYRRCYRYLNKENTEQNDKMTDTEFFSTNPTLHSEKLVEEKEIDEKEFEEGYRIRCYRRIRYVRRHGRLYRITYRRCYRYLQANKLNDAATKLVEQEAENVEVTEKEFTENSRCRYYYRYCRYFRYYRGQYYSRPRKMCFRRCYNLESEKDLSNIQNLAEV
jgi:hypothetical protein